MSSVLADLSKYQNQDVIARFLQRYRVSEDEANLLFQEVKKLLWLFGVLREKKIRDVLYIDISMIMLDEMWHNFAIFTHDYEAFCKKYCNGLIYHAPASVESKRKQVKQRTDNYQEWLKKVEQDTESLITVVYDYLGEETTLLWFETLPNLYNQDRLKNVLKPLG